MGLLCNSALLIGIAEFLVHEGDGVEFVVPEELLYFVDLVYEEEYLLAVEFEFEVSHAEIDSVVAPFEDALVLHQRDALSVQPEESLTPRKTTVHQFKRLAAYSQTELSSHLYLNPYLTHPSMQVESSPSNCLLFVLHCLFALFSQLRLGYLVVPDAFDDFLEDETALSAHHLIDDGLQVYFRVDGIYTKRDLGGCEGEGEGGDVDSEAQMRLVPVFPDLQMYLPESVAVLQYFSIDVCEGDGDFELKQEFVEIVTANALTLNVRQSKLVFLHCWHCFWGVLGAQ